MAIKAKSKRLDFTANKLLPFLCQPSLFFHARELRNFLHGKAFVGAFLTSWHGCMPKTSIPNARTAKNGAPGKLAIPETSQQRPHLTAVPIEQDSDWVRLPKPRHLLCGLGRSYLFQLAKRGKIKSVALRAPDKARGVRLLYKPSILAFIEAQSAIQNAPAEAAR